MTRAEALTALLAHFGPGRERPKVRIVGNRRNGYAAGLVAPPHETPRGKWAIHGTGGNIETAVYLATSGCSCGGALRGYIFHGIGFCCSVAVGDRRAAERGAR